MDNFPNGVILSVAEYNPYRDIKAVVPTDIIDIADAFINGHIPDNVIAPDSDYDNNDKPASIIGRPRNEFDAIHMAETINNLSKSAGDDKPAAE